MLMGHRSHEERRRNAQAHHGRGGQEPRWKDSIRRYASPCLRPKFPILRSSLGSSSRRTKKAHPFFFTVEFRKFVEKAERQLFALFRAIDKDGNGKLDKLELQTAFKNAGLTLSNRRLAEFFNDMDLNNDGYVSFDEWRLVTPFSIFSASFFFFQKLCPGRLHCIICESHSSIPIR